MNYKLFIKFIIYNLQLYLRPDAIGILNLLSKNFYNKNFKLNINGIILSNKMKKWYCQQF